MKQYLMRLFVTLLIINAVFLPIGCTVWIRNIPRDVHGLLRYGLYFYNKKHSTKFATAKGEDGAIVLTGMASSKAQKKDVLKYTLRFLSANHVDKPNVIDHILVKK